MTESHGLEPVHTRDEEFAPVLRDEGEPTEGDTACEEGRAVTGTGVPTRLPREETDARSPDEGPAVGTSAHDGDPRTG